jgi:hypothetical protein
VPRLAKLRAASHTQSLLGYRCKEDTALPSQHLDMSVPGHKRLVTIATTSKTAAVRRKVQGTARLRWAYNDQLLAAASSAAHACIIEQHRESVHVCVAVKLSTAALEKQAKLPGLQAPARGARGAPQHNTAPSNTRKLPETSNVCSDAGSSSTAQRPRCAAHASTRSHPQVGAHVHSRPSKLCV